MTISEATLTAATVWLEQDPDAETRAELRAMLESGDAELEARFAGRLQFGTAGIRGVLGAGPMCMNQVVVRQVSAGLADYVIDNVEHARERGLVVAHDARKNSRLFAEDAARVFAGKGIKVHLFERDVPTPTAAFAVLDRGAAAGVMVTASHNPPEYNGYKVYWENGAQIIPPHDGGIAAAIERVGRTDALEMPELGALRGSGRLEDLGEAIEQRYLDEVQELSVHGDASARAPITVVYTAMHGVGDRFVAAALKAAGFDDVHSEPSQRDPDPAFPTVAFPNPEEKGAMDRALALAAKVSADIVIANDPDADRLAVGVPEGEGYRMFTGDQVGALLADYLLTEGPDGDRMVATTIVSSQLLGAMAAELGIAFQQTLTGFKWIANAAMDYSTKTGGRFVMGYEEALGYTVGELVRDKDGVSAALLFAELVAWDKSHGRTAIDRLESIYRRYGLYLTEQVSLVLPGAEGLAQIAALMTRFRDSPPAEVAGHLITAHHDLATGALDLPKSNVLIDYLEGGRRIIMRPSGTEPKLKSYYEVRETIGADESIDDALSRARASLASLRGAHQAMLAE